jgi:hypothetical protein
MRALCLWLAHFSGYQCELSTDPRHKTAKVRAWFAARPRYHVHFTPTSASWINQVERFFGLISERWIKRNSHRSTRELGSSIKDYLKIYNEDPKPFEWHKSADQIIESIARLSDKLNKQTDFCQGTLARA